MTRLNKISLITINILLWLCVFAVGFLYTWEFVPFSTKDGSFYPSMIWGNIINAIVFYVHGLWLFPRRHQIAIPYWLGIVLLILSTSIVESVIDYGLIFHLGIEEKIADIISPKQALITSFTFDNIITHLGWYIFSFVLIFFTEYAQNEQVKKNLQQEKLKSELKFLKAQINPHFLFNGINSVYFLIDEQPEIAKSTLLKFSDLLRYQLYECQDELIPLEKELAHIESYVEMEKIRRGEDATIQLRLAEEMQQEQISPLLFTPFLENAFKYLSNKDDGKDNRVFIDFRVQEGQLFFEIENTMDQKPNKKEQKGGIGIDNVKKRLALLYPNQHQLDIFERDEHFYVRLILQLRN